MLRQLFDVSKLIATKPLAVFHSWQEDDRLRERMDAVMRIQQKCVPDLDALTLHIDEASASTPSDRLKSKFANVAKQFTEVSEFHKNIDAHIAQAKATFNNKAALETKMFHAPSLHRLSAESDLTFSRGAAGKNSALRFQLGQTLLDMKVKIEKDGSYDESLNMARLIIIEDILDAQMKATAKNLRVIAGAHDPVADREAENAMTLSKALLSGEPSPQLSNTL